MKYSEKVRKLKLSCDLEFYFRKQILYNSKLALKWLRFTNNITGKFNRQSLKEIVENLKYFLRVSLTEIALLSRISLCFVMFNNKKNWKIISAWIFLENQFFTALASFKVIKTYEYYYRKILYSKLENLRFLLRVSFREIKIPECLIRKLPQKFLCFIMFSEIKNLKLNWKLDFFRKLVFYCSSWF